MNQNPTVKELRSKNYKVRINHFRYTSTNSDLYSAREIRESWGDLALVEPRGGKISVEITTPDGKNCKGEAVCNRKEPFNKTIGRSIALGRALKSLEES